MNSKEGNTTIDISVIEEKVNSIAELATVEYHYTTLAKYENYKDFYGWKIPLTTTKFLITYDGTIKAGIDLSKVKITLVDKNVLIEIPKATVLSHEVEFDTMQIMYESYSIFNRLVISDYNDFMLNEAKTMVTKAANDGLFQKAQQNAIKIIQDLIEPLIPDEYEYSIRLK
jgi:archaellin